VSRVRTRTHLRLFSLTFFGTLVSLAISSQRAELLLAGLFVGAYGMSSYVQQSARITVIATYIRTVLRERVASGVGTARVFEWEEYFRECESEDMKRLESAHNSARWIANAISFGGPILTGAIVPPICVVAKAQAGTMGWYTCVWILAVWLLGIAVVAYLGVLLVSWHKLQVARRTPGRG